MQGARVTARWRVAVALGVVAVALGASGGGCTDLSVCSISGGGVSSVPTDVPTCCSDENTYIIIPAAHCPGCDGCASASAYAVCNGKTYAACVCTPPSNFTEIDASVPCVEEPDAHSNHDHDAGDASLDHEVDATFEGGDAEPDASPDGSRKRRDASADGEGEGEATVPLDAAHEAGKSKG